LVINFVELAPIRIGGSLSRATQPTHSVEEDMKDILDQMEEHIAAIRNLQRNFDYHSKRLEKLMLTLNNRYGRNNQFNEGETHESHTNINSE